MKQLYPSKNTLSFIFLFIFFFHNQLSTPLKSQTIITDTLYETTNEITWLSASNDHFGWFEWTPNGQSLYRGNNNIIESQLLDSIYHDCNSFNGLYIYNDFIQMKINDDTSAACNKEFIWDGQNMLIEDSLNIGEVQAQYNNLLFNDYDTLINLETGTKEKLVFETAEYRYFATNIIDFNREYMYIKAGKYDKTTFAYLGAAIIKYNLELKKTLEIFSSTNFLHFSNQGATNEAIVFIEDQPAPANEKLYLYDGGQITLITQRDITNSFADPYLDGVVYVSNDSLFYWENGLTTVLSDNAFRFIIDGCKLAWFSGSGVTAQLNFYDGIAFDSVEFVGYPEAYNLNFLADNSFIFSFTTLDISKKYIVKGNYDSPQCPDNNILPDAAITDTVHETTNEVVWLSASNSCYSWYESTLAEKKLYRGNNDVLENQVLAQTYVNCNSFNGLYIYNDFIQMKINDDTSAACNQGFIWDGHNMLIEDPLNIGEVYAQYNNLLFNDRDTLINLDTRTKEQLVFETNDFLYYSSNIVNINDNYMYVKAGKRDKNNNLSYLGEAIIKYNLQSKVTLEIFFSTNFLHFSTQGSTDNVIVFTEEQAAPANKKMYFYDGNQVSLITQRDITNGVASPYLEGVVYVSDDSLFFWNEGNTAVLDSDVFSFRKEGCKLGWFSGFGQTAQLNFYDGATFNVIPFQGYQEHYSLNFLAENSFIFSFTTLDNSKKYVVKGNHGLTNPTNCNYPDIAIADEQSYVKVKNMTSQAVLNQGLTVYQATEYISLLPGFSVAANTSFIAQIKDCTPSSFHAEPTERNSIVAKNTIDNQEIAKKPISFNRPTISQNSPNPFSYGSTRIEYSIPTGSQQAAIIIFNAWGQKTEQFPIKNFGSGALDLRTDKLQKGIYHYILEVDGEIIASKKMISLK